MKQKLWIVLAAVLMALGLGSYFYIRGTGEWPLLLSGLSVLVVLFHFRARWKAICAVLIALALFLRFALRGYGYWAYAAAFVAFLILAVSLRICIGLVFSGLLRSGCFGCAVVFSRLGFGNLS